MDIDYGIILLLPFSKFCETKIFSFSLEEILPLALKFIYILPNFGTETLTYPAEDPPLHPISVMGYELRFRNLQALKSKQ